MYKNNCIIKIANSKNISFAKNVKINTYILFFFVRFSLVLGVQSIRGPGCSEMNKSCCRQNFEFSIYTRKEKESRCDTIL